ncbi:hypothetical protein LDO26_09745 [Luteimonas sp. BDR2-5]|uniref:hypothetical protein n=1 Tax=Proluteimonas luteida TaxID=2878685 RepID=UPI001E40A96E|nr:hypothetical protein [Luteimonas sp. BDR2-5]MCD9028488.1 hypothetical protein [Luteimonas sp. BDR2-5]
MQFAAAVEHAQLAVVAVGADPQHARQFDECRALCTPDAEVAGAACAVAPRVEQAVEGQAEALARERLGDEIQYAMLEGLQRALAMGRDHDAVVASGHHAPRRSKPSSPPRFRSSSRPS